MRTSQITNRTIFSNDQSVSDPTAAEPRMPHGSVLCDGGSIAEKYLDALSAIH